MLNDPKREASDWGCSRCGRKDTSALAESPDDERRRVRACDGPLKPTPDNPEGRFRLASAPDLRRCPWSVIGQPETDLIRQWRRWQVTGVWPFAGGPDEQSPRIVDAFEILERCDRQLRERK